MAKRPEELIYAVDEHPPWPSLLLLGLQYAGLLTIYLVMIAIVFKAAGASHADTRSAVSFGMIAVAVATMLQALRKGPIGSGFLAAPVFSAIYLGPSILAAQAGGLPAVFGMTILAGAVEILIAPFLRRLRAFFPPAISGFIIVIVGIQLGLVAIEHVLDMDDFEKPEYLRHIVVSLLTLSVIVGLSVWSSGTARLMCSMIGLAFGFVIAWIFGIIPAGDWRILSTAPLLALPDPSFISYDFEPTLLPAFLIGGVAAALRTVGVITTCQKINDEDWKRPDLTTIKGGMVADGIGCMLAGAMGCIGMNAAPSLVGVSKATGATSRSIAFAAGGFLILFSVAPAIASVFLILPNSVVGAALLFTASFMIAGGIQVMATRNLDARMNYVIGISMLLGLSREVFQNFFKSLPETLHPLTSSMLALAVISALTLHAVFRIGSGRTASFTIDRSEHPVSDLAALMEKKGKTWNVGQDVTSRAIATTSQVIEHIQRADLASGDLKAMLRYDDLNLVVSISYQGALLSLPNVGIRRRSFLEEESFSYGLADFLTGVYPDRMESVAHGSNIAIQLYFSV